MNLSNMSIAQRTDVFTTMSNINNGTFFREKLTSSCRYIHTKKDPF